MSDLKNSFISDKLKYLPKRKHEEIIERLNESDDTQLALLNGVNLKKPAVWFAFYWFIPLMWIFDRLVIGQWITGIVKIVIALLTYSVCVASGENTSTDAILFFLSISAIIVLYDTFSFMYRIRKLNYNKVKKILPIRYTVI
jgi:hypothetical protein